ncbi:putative quinol monooxygenase [Oricola sp.]|uniref:putative quinol monooxygenase n=1 Tax=Oricola sp. TaxID=1979950 RepID=UPI000C98679C|nr:antibiotic biosynthesis monooxygenase [Ahrensia sp.]MCK5750780.1 antibiotic biosynthesis monooxygenase [Oricola sp.]|tara:strand:- start:7158 stop:7502 length:345 start_codon:yes stop_codon:yes gene_type:complete
MRPFAVAVRFVLHAGQSAEFEPLIRQQAAQSLAEPGCLVFEIWQDPTRADEIFLWEVYESPEAFETHLKSDHFQRFDASVGGLVRTKSVETWNTALSFDRPESSETPDSDRSLS